VHGAALYNCVDITFADPKDVPEVNASNCANSSDIGFNNVYSSALTTTSAARPSRPRMDATWVGGMGMAVLVAGVVAGVVGL
jgi:hypothetical protein